MYSPLKAEQQDSTKPDQDSKKNAVQVMDECDLSNLESIDTTMNILWEPELMGCITAKKPALTKKHLKTRLSCSQSY